MKHLFWLCSFLLLIGCTENEIIENNVANNKKFYATIEGTDSRTYVDEKIRLRWTAEDCITIFDKTTYNREFMFTGKTGANAGGFTQKSVDDKFRYEVAVDNIYAVYPHSLDIQLDETDLFLTLDMPTEQTYVENSFGLGANTMVAVSETGQLYFKNVGSFLRILLYGEDATVKSITLTSKGEEAIAGKAKVTPSMDGDPTCEMIGSTKSITLNCTTPVTISSDSENPTGFWIVVPPVTFAEGFTVTVTNSEDKTQVYDVNQSFTFGRNLYYDLEREVTIEDSSIPNNEIWYTSSDGNVVTPYSTTGFGANIVSNIYENGKGIITFDGDVTMIGNYAFNSRRSLVSISIPNSVTTIGDGAFKTCTSLTNMTISNNVTAIGESAFESCNSLTNITIPNSVTTIEDRTFYSCYKLDNISIPNGVTSIGKQAFSGCETLTSITIPASVTTIGEKAFTYCRSLANIIVNEENLFYDSRENCNAIINTASNTLISGCKNTIIPNSVTIIGKGAFQACYDMVDITIPNSVTTIGEDAFDNCSSLTEITIPNSVTTIGDRAFFLCSSLSRVNIKAITPPATGVYIFQNCSSNIEFYVPAESLETYKAADYWKDLNLLLASEDWFNPNQYITYVKNHEWVYVGSKNYYQYSSYINCPVKNISKIEFKYKLTDFNLSHYVYLCSNNIAADKTSSIYLSKDDGLVIKNENWDEDDGWILNSTVNYSWNELDVDMTDCMTFVASFKNKYIHLNNVELEYKISEYTSFESKYLFTYYTHENDEGIWCVLGEGVPEGSKLYYVKIWDENDDIVYLGAASKAMNPTTNKEEYCWKSYYNGEYNYEFAYYPTTHSDYTPYGGGID